MMGFLCCGLYVICIFFFQQLFFHCYLHNQERLVQIPPKVREKDIKNYFTLFLVDCMSCSHQQGMEDQRLLQSSVCLLLLKKWWMSLLWDMPFIPSSEWRCKSHIVLNCSNCIRAYSCMENNNDSLWTAYTSIKLLSTENLCYLYSGTSHNGLSEIRTTYIQWTDNVPPIDFAIEVIHFQPPRNRQPLVFGQRTECLLPEDK